MRRARRERRWRLPHVRDRLRATADIRHAGRAPDPVRLRLRTRAPAARVPREWIRSVGLPAPKRSGAQFWDGNVHLDIVELEHQLIDRSRVRRQDELTQGVHLGGGATGNALEHNMAPTAIAEDLASNLPAAIRALDTHLKVAFGVDLKQQLAARRVAADRGGKPSLGAVATEQGR